METDEDGYIRVQEKAFFKNEICAAEYVLKPFYEVFCFDARSF